MWTTYKHNKKSGFTFLEIVISIAIISIAFGGLLGAGFSVFNLSRSIWQTTTAQSLAVEELESVRAWRDSTSWSVDGLGLANTGAGSEYYLSADTTGVPNKWELSSGSETLEGFTRKVFFDKVSRDPSSGDIQEIYNSSYDDPDTRKATAIVSWQDGFLQVVTYFTNWH